MPSTRASEESLNRSTPSAPPKLVLEPVRASSRFRSFPLAPGRYLIGSGEDCDLIIPVSGVASQHCLMIVGTNRTIVKSLSPLTWIDDGPLTESVLQHGQRLILGPVELRTRRPDLSEWLETPEDRVPRETTAPYQPPQIEELLQQAQLNLETALSQDTITAKADTSPTSQTSTDPWSDDLPLTEAVNRHAQSVDDDSIQVSRAEHDARTIELEERSRSLDYLSGELNAQQSRLLDTEESLRASQAEFEERIRTVEMQHREVLSRELQIQESQQVILQQSEELNARQAALLTLQSDLDNYRLELAQREEQLESQQSELQRRTDEVVRREHHLQTRDRDHEEQITSLTVRIHELEEQLRLTQPSPNVSVQTLIDQETYDFQAEELSRREASVTRREALLAQSQASLRVSQEQLQEEAAGLDARLAEILQREQQLLSRTTSIREEITHEESRLKSIREECVSQQAQLTSLSERETSLAELKKNHDQRERELRNLRSELDIREESLEQQFAQLQLDRTTFRAAQSRLQLAEQALQQRELQWAEMQQAQTVVGSQSSQDANQDIADLVERERTLSEQVQKLEQQIAEFQQQETALDCREHELNQLELQLQRDRVDLKAQRTQWEMECSQHGTDRVNVSSPGEKSHLSSLKQELLDEQRELRAEREELRKSRQQFEQERLHFQQLRDEAQTERDTFLLERQAIITERQALRDRERLILTRESESEQKQEELQAARQELGIAQDRLEEERIHLEEEWEALRQERAEHSEVQNRIDAQREELTELAQQLADLQNAISQTSPASSASGATVEPEDLLTEEPLDAPLDPEGFDAHGQQEDIEQDSEDSIQETDEALLESEEEEKEPDALAGFASFSAIGQSSEEQIPPEVAEILRKTAGQHVSTPQPPAATIRAPEPPPVPLPASAPPSTLTGRLDALLGIRKAPGPVADTTEKSRVEELLSKTSDEFVDAASRVLEEDVHSVEDSEQFDESPEEEMGAEYADDLDAESSDGHAQVEEAHDAQSSHAADDIRARLSEMFGINLGGSLKPEPEPELEEPTEALAEVEEEYAQQEAEPEPEPEPVAESSESESTEPLDPVAAYMEQLLARTRKAKDSAVKSQPTTPPAKPVFNDSSPAVVDTPAIQKVETPTPIVEPEPEPEETQRAVRKLDAAEKVALRANLDSFRTIANSQARSDVARSEFRRLKVTVKVKRVFVGVSSLITLIMISTFIWADRGYYLECLAAIIATAFLSVDFVRSEKRLRELAVTTSDDDVVPE